MIFQQTKTVVFRHFLCGREAANWRFHLIELLVLMLSSLVLCMGNFPGWGWCAHMFHWVCLHIQTNTDYFPQVSGRCLHPSGAKNSSIRSTVRVAVSDSGGLLIFPRPASRLQDSPTHKRETWQPWCIGVRLWAEGQIWLTVTNMEKKLLLKFKSEGCK